jgi:hypothetical protein
MEKGSLITETLNSRLLCVYLEAHSVGLTAGEHALLPPKGSRGIKKRHSMRGLPARMSFVLARLL